MLINNYLSFQSPHRSLKGFVNLVYFKNVRALQSVVDKNTYLVEKMSTPHLATLKGGEMFFTLNFSPNTIQYPYVFLFMIFLSSDCSYISVSRNS